MPSHRVIINLIATVDVDAGSPDEARAVVQSALGDFKFVVASPAGPLGVRVGLADAEDVVAVIGEGEDPAAD